MTTHHLAILLTVLLIGSAPAAACTGDCDDDGHVGVDETVRGVDIALGDAPLDDCGQFDVDDDGTVAVNAVKQASPLSRDTFSRSTPPPPCATTRCSWRRRSTTTSATRGRSRRSTAP